MCEEAIETLKKLAESILNDLVQRSKEKYISPGIMFVIYAGLRNNDKACELLERAYEQRDSVMPFLKMPDFSIVHSEPWFKEMLKKIGLE
jgi:hypothetical protein